MLQHLDNISAKKKLYISIAIFAIMLLLIYRNYISPLMNTKQLIENTETEIKNINTLTARARQAGDKLPYENLRDINQKKILTFLNHTSKHIPKMVIEEISDIHIYKTENNLAIETYVYNVKGTYSGFVELLDSIYITYPGTLRSINLKTKKKSYNAKNELHAQLFFQKNY